MSTRTLPHPQATLHRRHPHAPPARPRLIVRIWRRMGGEVKDLFPPWIFLLLSFSLLRLTQSVILKDAGIGIMPHSKVLVGSILVAKALLTVDKLHLFTKLQRAPVIVLGGFKTLVYFAVALVFQYFDGLYEFRHHQLNEAAAMVGQRFATARFWLIQVWLLVLLAILTLTREFIRRIGHRRFRRLFLGR